jgi:hypothetical protein
MTQAPRHRVAIVTRAPSMEILIPDVVVQEEPQPLTLETGTPTEGLVMPTHQTGWVDASSKNLGPEPTGAPTLPAKPAKPVINIVTPDAAPKQPIELASGTTPPTEGLVMPTHQTGWVDDSSKNLGPEPTAVPSVAAWASSTMEAEQAAKVRHRSLHSLRWEPMIYSLPVSCPLCSVCLFALLSWIMPPRSKRHSRNLLLKKMRRRKQRRSRQPRYSTSVDAVASVYTCVH